MSLKLQSLLGLVVFILLAWGLSTNKRAFPWRTVIWGLVLQVVFALLILKTTFGMAVFDLAQQAVERLTGFAQQGSGSVFGPLSNNVLLGDKLGPGNGFIFAVTVSSVIIFISSLSALLFHWGLLPFLMKWTATFMQKIMRTSGTETLAAAANVFLGQTEAPLVIKPYLAGMTRSELLAVMVGGMASVSGSVLAAYASMGMSTGHMVTASIMSAPASLLFAKIMMPETERSPALSGETIKLEKPDANAIDALCRGASEGLFLALNVIAMLIAFVAAVALCNYLLVYFQHKVGIVSPVTLQKLFGWLNAPSAWLLGIPAKDVVLVSQIMGERIVLNEFFAYVSLSQIKETLDPRTLTLATYALCGFANFASIAVQVGGIGSMIPNRRKDLAQLGMRAMVGGLLACYSTASIAGLLID